MVIGAVHFDAVAEASLGDHAAEPVQILPATVKVEDDIPRRSASRPQAARIVSRFL